MAITAPDQQALNAAQLLTDLVDQLAAEIPADPFVDIIVPKICLAAAANPLYVASPITIANA